MISYEMERLLDCAIMREDGRRRSVYWARRAMEGGATKAAVAKALEISRPTLDAWLMAFPAEKAGTLTLDLSDEQYQRLEEAAVYAGKTVEEFGHIAIMRKAREALNLAEEESKR